MRDVLQLIAATRQREGAGFVVRRPFPTAQLEQLDPFLLLDEMGPVDYAPGEAVGAPDHPHRGFETVTYMLEGEFEHADSAGNRGTIAAGDVQWMTAGDGVIHSELPSARIRRDGGRVHGFQIWVNLPAVDKRLPPRYQDVRAATLPTWRAADGRATVKVIAGRVLGVDGGAQTRIPITLLDVALAPGGAVELDLPIAQSACVYVFEGAVRIGAPGTPVPDGHLALLSPGTVVQVAADAAPARALLLAAVPIGEPVVRYGPFVMNTVAEIHEAFEDYRSGRFGSIAPAG